MIFDTESRTSRETYAVDNVETFKELIVERASRRNFNTDEDLEAVASTIWDRLTSDDPMYNLQAAVFEDIHGDRMRFYRGEWSVMYTQVTVISRWRYFKFLVWAYWGEFTQWLHDL